MGGGLVHDGSAKGPKQVSYGNNWVILGILVSLPMLDRPVCLPVAARLVRKDTTSASRLWLAVQMVTTLAKALPGRRIQVVADAAYAGAELKLPGQVTANTRVSLIARAPSATAHATSANTRPRSCTSNRFARARDNPPVNPRRSTRPRATWPCTQTRAALTGQRSHRGA